MNIIFLDIDGVLNCEQTFIDNSYLSLNKNDRINYYANMLDINKLEILYNFIKIYDFKIVISSSWRLTLNLDEFYQIFNLKYKTDWKPYIIAMTNTSHKERGLQILEYLNNNSDINKYFVIDDDAKDIEPYFNNNNFIKTTWKLGLTEEHIKKMINFL